MAVTDEQRAMLQLLLEGGQGYEDIGSLLGIGPDEVRSRARSALQEIGGADPDAQVALSDYLLGQADPIGRADAIRHLQSDPEANALAERLVQNLRLLAPKGQLPDIPEARGGRRAAAPTPPPSAPPAGAPAPPATPPPTGAEQPQKPGIASRAAGFFSGLGRMSGKRRTQFLVGLGGGLALIIVIIIVATSGGGGGGQVVTVASGDTRTVSDNCKPVNATAPQQAGVPTMKLLAAGAAADADCPPSGQLILASQSQQTSSRVPTLQLQTNAVHITPPASGEGYLLWLYKSDSQSVPLGPASVDGNGNLTASFPIPTQELLLFLAVQTLRITKLTTAQGQQIQQAIQSQGKRPTFLIPFVGTTVLQGNVSELGLQQRIQQAQAQAQAQQGGTGQSGQAQQGAKGRKG